MTRITLLGVVAVLLAACGSSSPAATPPVAANTVTGAASCASGQTQDLTFSGYATGHVACSTAPGTCVDRTLRDQFGMSAPVNALIGGTSIQIQIVFEQTPVKAGSYAAGSIGDAQTSTPDGVTLDGIGHWQTQAGAGTMSIDELSSSGAAGKLDVKLVKGTDSITVSGSWRCQGSPGPLA